MTVVFHRSGLVTEADWADWKAEDFKPYVEVNIPGLRYSDPTYTIYVLI